MRARSLVSVSMFAMLGCGSEPARCTVDAECATGTTCKSGVCGAFKRPRPAACSDVASAGPFQVVDHSKLEMLLPGCWVQCDPPARDPNTPVGPAPAHAIGMGFNSDLTRWWFLVDDGKGNAVPYHGFDQGGYVDVLWLGINTDQLQVNMIATGNLTFGFQPQFSDGPPVRMSAVGVYVHPDTPCDGVDGGTSGGGADAGNAAPFGAACDPNGVLSTDCAAVDRRRCSFCGFSTCRQPCHLGGTDCPSSQTCTAFGLTMVVMAGDCIGYDGFCS